MKSKIKNMDKFDEEHIVSGGLKVSMISFAVAVDKLMFNQCQHLHAGRTCLEVAWFSLLKHVNITTQFIGSYSLIMWNQVKCFLASVQTQTNTPLHSIASKWRTMHSFVTISIPCIVAFYWLAVRRRWLLYWWTAWAVSPTPLTDS